MFILASVWYSFIYWNIVTRVWINEICLFKNNNNNNPIYKAPKALASDALVAGQSWVLLKSFMKEVRLKPRFKDLKTDNESVLITVSGNEFQTDNWIYQTDNGIYGLTQKLKEYMSWCLYTNLCVYMLIFVFLCVI